MRQYILIKTPDTYYAHGILDTEESTIIGIFDNCVLGMETLKTLAIDRLRIPFGEALELSFIICTQLDIPLHNGEFSEKAKDAEHENDLAYKFCQVTTNMIQDFHVEEMIQKPEHKEVFLYIHATNPPYYGSLYAYENVVEFNSRQCALSEIKKYPKHRKRLLRVLNKHKLPQTIVSGFAINTILPY